MPISVKLMYVYDAIFMRVLESLVQLMEASKRYE